MSNANDYFACARLADELIEQATKAELPEVTQLLALNIGCYHEKYGDVPRETLLWMVKAETLGEETKRLLLRGLQNLVSALGEVRGLAAGGDDEPRH